MFEGFVTEQVDVGEAQLLVRHGGAGPAVLLLHGHPRTSATWHRVAPRLAAEGFTVLCPDLRGYGASSKPATTPDHAPYSKRAMAQDVQR
ncbi:MAG: alpha/beta fold hydrolase [Pseudonocardiales bacterium]